MRPKTCSTRPSPRTIEKPRCSQRYSESITKQACSSLRLHDRTLELNRALLVGVLNLTPDSFSDGGAYVDSTAAVAAAQRLILAGADILDIGAESSRPGADPVSAEQEIQRLREVVPAVLELGAPVSIDTYKAPVADRALRWGAHLINDISGLDEAMLEVVADHDAPVIVMHMAGTPQTMQRQPIYQDVISEVYDFLENRIAAGRRAGVQTIADLGFGFGKSLEHNLDLLRALPRFHRLGVPLLLGTSRKSSIGALTGASVHERIEGTLATAAWALERGVQLLRVHDVAEHRQLLQVTSALLKNPPSPNTTIRLKGISADLHLGVPEEERASMQTVSIDLDFHFAYQGDDDHVEDTLDYSALPQRIKDLCSSQPFKLLETLAEFIADNLFEDVQAQHLTVRIHKPNAADAIGCEAVILERRFSRPSSLSVAPKTTAFVALGSNLGDRRSYLDNAVAELRRLGIVEKVSPWIETAPEGGTDQPNYLNGVAQIRTNLTPRALLVQLLEIERRFGRRRPASRESDSEQYGPERGPQKNEASRTLDLDLLLFGDRTIESEKLTLPHPRLHLRHFVLSPLATIAPDVTHPLLQRTAAELLAALDVLYDAPQPPLQNT